MCLTATRNLPQWIWNRKADINGNITTWLAVQNNEKICENIDEFKEITAAILKAKTAEEAAEAEAHLADEASEAEDTDSGNVDFE